MTTLFPECGPLLVKRTLCQIAVLSILSPGGQGLLAQTVPEKAGNDLGTLTVHLLGRRVGHETYALQRSDRGVRLSSNLDFIDRGSHVQLESELRTRRDFTPEAFRAKGQTYRFVNVDVDVAIANGRAAVRSLGDSAVVEVPSPFFTSRGYAPLSGRALLVQYWESQKRPSHISNIPGQPGARIAIAFRGVDTIRVQGRSIRLRRYSVDGVVWGREAVWLDSLGHLAALITRVHILPLEAVRSDLESALAEFQASAVRDRMRDLVRLSGQVTPVATGSYALVHGRLVDGTDKPPVEDATIVIRAGRVAAAGAGNAVPIPAGTKVIDVRGKTIVPGLWDMHAHVSQIEWAPAYLGAGVTSVRDMGGESGFLAAFRDTLASARAIGPQLLLAGLVDGPGPNGFGSVIAATPDEGRAIVDAYRAQGFRQIKLYNSITAPVAGAIIRRAHELGMTVAGHVPNAMGLRAVIDSGMDHVAHMPLSGDPSAGEFQQMVTFLAAKHTVLDPTIAWNELLGRAPSTAPESFEPGVRQSPPPMALNYTSVRTRTDSAGAARDQARGLAIFKALHDAGIPIVAGTDGGVPGHSLFRELELSVAAGLTPLEAIQSATIVAARAMGMEHDYGTVEAGKVADLLILDADPLSRISDIRSGRWVISRGRMYDCASLWTAAGFMSPASR